MDLQCICIFEILQMKRREVLLDQKHMDSQHMMQNGNHGNSDKFHCHLCNFDGVNIEVRRFTMAVQCRTSLQIYSGLLYASFSYVY